MTLAEYLQATGKTEAEFAREIRVHRSTVNRWLKARIPGEKVPRPNWEELASIKAATGGLVTPDDFLGDDWDHAGNAAGVADPSSGGGDEPPDVSCAPHAA